MFNVKTNFLKSSFISAVITECNKLDISIRNSFSRHVFRNFVLNLLDPNQVEFLTVGDWDNLGRVIAQTIRRAFSFLLNPQKLGRVV